MPPRYLDSDELFGYLSVHNVRRAFTLLLQYFGHLKMYNIGGIFVECLDNVVCIGALFVFTSLLSFECLAVYFVGCRPLWCIGLSHMAESSVKVLQTVGFMLFLYQRDLGGPCRNHPPGVV